MNAAFDEALDGRRVHPVAALFPMLDEVALRALADDIEKNGLVEPIVVHDGVILDGRNRLAACDLIDLEPDFRDWEGEESEIPAWIFSKNLHRRHLDEDARRFLAVRLADLYAQQAADRARVGTSTPAPNGARVGKSTDLAAADMNVSARSVERARSVVQNGAPEVEAAVRSGDVSLAEAAELVAAIPDLEEQRLLLDAPEKRKGAVREARERRHAGVLAPPAMPPDSPADRPKTYEEAVEFLKAADRAEEPRCGALHPETGLPCREKPGHTWTHGYIHPDGGRRIPWPIEEEARAPAMPPEPPKTTAYQRGLDQLDQEHEAATRVTPSLDDLDDTDTDLDDPFGELVVDETHHVNNDTNDYDMGTPVTGPEAEALLEDDPIGRIADALAADPDRDDDYEPMAAPAPISKSPTYDGDSWSTPDDIIAAAREVLGDIDLDPATNDKAQARIKATRHYTKEDDGLLLGNPWAGRVWLNPPYRRGMVGLFIDRLVAEYDRGSVTAALLLVNNATETKWCQALLARFPACFLAGRVPFLYEGVEGEAGARQGQVLLYLGPDPSLFRLTFLRFGVVLVHG